jgi:hypothetical protein
MNVVFILLWMIFFHIVDDYYLQGWLASAKQKSYWQENAPDELYKRDYIWALIMHSFSWAFMIMLPIAYFYSFSIGLPFVIILLINVTCHAFTDNAKANLKLINLWQDQLVHILQIGLTWLLVFV